MAISKKDFMKAKSLEDEIKSIKTVLRTLEQVKKDGYKWRILRFKKQKWFFKRTLEYEIPIDLDDVDYLIKKQLQRITALEKELAEIVTE